MPKTSKKTFIDFFKNYEIIYPIGSIIFTVIVLWLNSQYVKKSEYDSTISTIQQKIITGDRDIQIIQKDVSVNNKAYNDLQKIKTDIEVLKTDIKYIKLNMERRLELEPR